MSEYQYYEFQAVDRPLDREAQAALRSISSRARITATSFTNHYDWGDFGGDPRDLMERWFDLHLHFSNWGARRLIIRLPSRFLTPADIAPFLNDVEDVEIWTADDNLLIDICLNNEDLDADWEDDGSGWLAALAPLRSELLSGDLRLFYLLWLTAVQYELVSDDEPEPLPGIGPLTASLECFAEFFDIDPDLVRAAAERGLDEAAPSADDLHEMLAAIPAAEKTDLLLRVAQGDAHVATELKRKLRKERSAPGALRTVGMLRQRAREIAEARERAAAQREEAEQRRMAEEAEKAVRDRLMAVRQQGVAVWGEIDEEIERRNARGYDRATSLLADLRVLAQEDDNWDDFSLRLASIRERHRNKGRFIERLAKLEF